jgi:hypothetical protein
MNDPNQEVEQQIEINVQLAAILAELKEIKRKQSKITWIELPFWHTVGNLLKISIAAVPAAIFATIFWVVFSGILLGMFR